MVLIDRIVYALCLIAPWSLLWLDSSLLFPYTTGKAWMFRATVELAFALSLILSLGQRTSGGARTKSGYISHVLVYVLLGFLVWTGLCNMFGLDGYRSFWSNWERMGGFVDYLHWAMYLFCLLSVVSYERIRSTLINLVSVITLVCLIGLFDDYTRSISTLGNPIYFGNLAVFGVFLSVWLFVGCKPGQGWKTWAFRLFIVLALVIAVVAIYKSASRGPLLALIVGALVMLMSVGFGLARQRGRLMGGVFLMTSLVIGGLLLMQTSTIQHTLEQSDSYALQRLGRVSLSNQTTADRLENWRIALDASQQHPWMGWGQENYMIAFNQYYRPGVIDKAKLWFDRAHNAYLDVLVASGVPGLLLYCLMLGLPIYLLRRIPGWSRLQKSSILALFTAFLFKNLVGFDTFSSNLVWLSLVAVILAAHKPPVVDVGQSGETSFLFRLFAIVLLMVSMLAIYGLNVRPYQDNLRFSALMNNPLALGSQQLENVLAQPLSSLRYAHNAKLVVLDAILTGTKGANLNAIDKQSLEKVIARAGWLVDDALSRQPENYRIKYNGALLAARLGQYKTAIRLLEELTQASPKRTAFWHALAKTYAAQGRDKSALLAHETAIKLNPDWKP